MCRFKIFSQSVVFEYIWKWKKLLWKTLKQDFMGTVLFGGEDGSSHSHDLFGDYRRNWESFWRLQTQLREPEQKTENQDKGGMGSHANNPLEIMFFESLPKFRQTKNLYTFILRQADHATETQELIFIKKSIFKRVVVTCCWHGCIGNTHRTRINWDNLWASEWPCL